MGPLLDFGVLINAVLFVVGLLWCREMVGRWRRDLEEYRSSNDSMDRLVIVLLWVATAVIFLLMINFVWGLLANLGLL